MGLSRTIASLEKDAVAGNGVINSESYDDEMAPPRPALSDTLNQNLLSSSVNDLEAGTSTSSSTTVTTTVNSIINSSGNSPPNPLSVVNKEQGHLKKRNNNITNNNNNNNNSNLNNSNSAPLITIPKTTDEGQQATDCPLSSSQQQMDEKPNNNANCDTFPVEIVGDADDDVEHNIAAITGSQPSISMSQQPNSQDMEQLINVNDMDLLQAIKNFDFLYEENLQEVMQTLETEGAHHQELGGNGDHLDEPDQFELAESPHKEQEEMDKKVIQQKLDDISREEAQLQRRHDFLVRRLYKLVARTTGLHVSEEVAGFLEHVARYCKRKDKEPLKLPITSSIHTSQLVVPQLTPAPPENLLQSPTHQSNSQISTTETAPNSNIPEIIPFQEPLPPAPATVVVTSTPTVPVIQQTSPEKLKPVSHNQMKSFLKRIANISGMQNTLLSKRGHAQKYFSKTPANVSPHKYEVMHSTHGSGHSHGKFTEPNIVHNTIPKFDDAVVEQLEQVSGLLHSELRMIQKNIDSDATASSSGGESADEMITYSNLHQQPLSIAKRAAYKYTKDRAAIASRWCWLTTQISDIEYRIRQHADLHKRLKESKGAILFEDVSQSLNGFRGQLPGATPSTSMSPPKTIIETPPNGAYDANTPSGSARTRAAILTDFRKRKLVQTANLHTISKRAARSSTVKCGCQWPLQPCALCTGRPDPTAPRDLPDTMPASERVALLDPGFHPVLSFPEDVSHSIHFEAIMNIPEWQTKVMKSTPKAMLKQAMMSTKSEKSVTSAGGNNNILEDYQNMKKPNIDISTGKRKWTKKGTGFDADFLNKLKNKKRGQFQPGVGGHVPRKYVFKKKRLTQTHQIGDMLSKSVPGTPINGMATDASSNSNQNNSDSRDNNSGLINRSKNTSPVPSSGNKNDKYESRRTRNYDIDNIVIPYSIAAATRVEILPYKEIPTPKWKIVEDFEEPTSNLLETKINYTSQNGQIDDQEPKKKSSENVNQVEDVSDEAILAKHERALLEERRKFSSYLKFPLTSRSRANRIDSRGNESSGANTPDPTSPATIGADIESIPSPATCPSTPLDGQELNEKFLVQVLNDSFNGRKERRRTTSKALKGDSAAPTRSSSPDNREMVPPYEPLQFPLTDDEINNMKRLMPIEHLQQVEQYFAFPEVTEAEIQQRIKQQRNPQRRIRRKHNDSLSESKLIKEKIQTTSQATNSTSAIKTNVLIPLTSHQANVINNAKINNTTTVATTDEISNNTVLKKLLNNNNHPALAGVAETVSSLSLHLNKKDGINGNGLDIAVGGQGSDRDYDRHISMDEEDDYLNDMNDSDSETETGEESSVFVPDEDEDDDESIIDDADEEDEPTVSRKRVSLKSQSSYNSNLGSGKKGKTLKGGYN